MGAKARISCVLPCLAALLLISCRSPGPPSLASGGGSGLASSDRESRLTRALQSDSEFEAGRAWSHLKALERLGPRVSGAEGGARARDYLRAKIDEIGLEIRERRALVEVPGRESPIELVHLTAVVPGRYADIVFLAAPYDTGRFDSIDFVGANEGASGAALLLELARVLAAGPRPTYTTWLTWIDGDALGHGDFAAPMDLPGSRSLVRILALDGDLARIRLAVFFGAVADTDLVITRDIRSHRVFREIFWQSASDLGFADAFPSESTFGASATAQPAFADEELRAGVAIADDRYGPGEAPGSYWHSESDTSRHCSPRSLDIVGRVTLDALSRIEGRLERLDAFARSPLDEASSEVSGEATAEEREDSRAGESSSPASSMATP